MSASVTKKAAVLLLTGVFAALAIQPAWALSPVPDSTWRTSGKVYALARAGNTLFVGGHLTRVHSGQEQDTVANLAAFDMTTGAWIPSFTPSVLNTVTSGDPRVRALDVSPDGSTLYIGGSFDTVDGSSVSNFAAVDTTTGALVPGFTPPAVTAPVNAILAGPSLVYVGGAFSHFAGRDRGYLAAINLDGSLNDTWLADADDTVRSLTLSADGQSIFVGGHFKTMDGQPRASVAEVSTDTGAVDPWTIPPALITKGATAWDMIATPTRLFVGFGTAGVNWLASYRLDDGDVGDQDWKYTTKGNVESLALSPDGSRLFFGGHFGTAKGDEIVCGGVYMRGLASLNPTNGQLYCDWLPQIEPFGDNFVGGWAMLQVNEQLWVGGGFTSISGANQSGIARFTLDDSLPPPAPSITSFSPAQGPVGTPVTISGSGFTGTFSVSFHNHAAQSFTVDSDTQITAIVPPDATTGDIDVSAPGGTTSSATSFKVSVLAIKKVKPTSGPVGTQVVLTGSGFTGATDVGFAGTSAAFTVTSDSSITAMVPIGAVSGLISVTGPSGTVSSPVEFDVTP